MDMLEKVQKKYLQVTEELINKNKTISVMESCTAGLISSLITDAEGSSAIFPGGFVTYSNSDKVMQGVPERIIDRYGVYSLRMAEEMARAAQKALRTDFAIGITGTFGNLDESNSDSEIGSVFFALATKNDVKAFHIDLPRQKNRFSYKLAAADAVVEELKNLI